jgi:ATP-dependent helicase/nuclease subunit A
VTERAALDPLGRDREARRLARTELERPLVLEAGAGTGKTTTLVARILAWCLGPGWQRAERRLAEAAPAGATPERVAETVLAGVVAITFTEAAAAQMAARVAGALAELAAGREPKHLDLPAPSAAAAGTLPLFGGQIRETRARHLLSALDHLTVATIHAWCLRLLSAHPLEAGLHPRLVVDADGRRLDETVTEVVEARLQDAYGPDPDEDYLELAGRGIGPREIAEAVTELVRAGVEAADLEEDPLGARPVAALVARLSRAARQLHRLVAPRLDSGSGQLAKAREVERMLARLLPELEQAELPALVARLATSTRACASG